MAIFLVFAFIFLSRILFLSISPSFFDSLEYLKLFNLPFLQTALVQAHYPIHPLWIITGWGINKIPFLSTLVKIEFFNSLLGTLACFLIYQIAQNWADKKQALLMTLICAFTPFFWLSQTNVLYEPLLGVFLLACFYFLLKKNYFYSALFFALSFLVSSTTLIYLFFLTGFFWNRGKPKNLLLSLFLGILLGLGGYLIIFSLVNINPKEILTILSSSNSFLDKLRLEKAMFFVRGIRNSLVIYFTYLTFPLAVLTFWGVWKKTKLKKNWPAFLGWLISFFLLCSLWHAGMFGRTVLFLTLVPIFLLINKNSLLFKLILVFLLIYSSFKVIPYRFQKTPYLLEQSFLSSLEKKPLLIISNYEEPYLKGVVFDYRVLNSPKTDNKEIKDWIAKNQKQNKIVFITPQALAAPYWQYDGLDFQILSKRKNYSQSEGEKLLDQFNLTLGVYY